MRRQSAFSSHPWPVNVKELLFWLYCPLLSNHHLQLHPTLSLLNMLTITSRVTSIYITITYTLDTMLSQYHPLITWLAMRQNNQQSIWLGDIIGFERIHGPAFCDQQPPVYGRISGISHFVQGFVIVMASMDPQTFKAFDSLIYVAIPRRWFSLSFRPSMIYCLTLKSLPIPQFLHLLDCSHGFYQLGCLKDDIEGARTVPQA